MPSHSAQCLLLTVVSAASAALACTLVTIPQTHDAGYDATTCDALTPRAVEILTENCGSCHGAGGPGLGGVSDILDLDALVAAGQLVFGDPDGSRIYARMLDTDAPMPPAGESRRPGADDVEAVRAWIAGCGAVEACGEQPFVARDEVLRRIRDDLVAVADNPASPRFTRYFSLVHLQNAGLCDAQIEPYRQALSKLVNSLSRGVEVVAPVAIDAERLLFRIDLRDYRWDTDGKEDVRLSEPTFYFDDPGELASSFVDRWEMIATQIPYTVEYLGSVAERIKADTGTPFFLLRADAFIDATARSPLYYDILDIPRCSTRFRLEDLACDPDIPCLPDDPCCEDCLDSLLGVSVLTNIFDELVNDGERVARAGLYVSGVSDHNRVLERHALPARDGAFWITYDFASDEGASNIRSHPLDFEFDGGEIIFTLPNGLQGYMLTDASGDRLNEAPAAIVQDPSQRDVIVRNGVSCIGCHDAGMLPGRDEIRSGLCDGQVTLGDEICETIEKLYPGQSTIDALLLSDSARYQAALERAGVPHGTQKEPVRAAFLAFDQDLAARRAAAELELPEDQLFAELARLSPDLQGLRDDVGTVGRRVFTASFAASACLLRLGRTRCCPNSVDALEPECVARP